MILICDSSALIALAICDKLDLLEKLFHKVAIPKAVFYEVTNSNKPEAEKLKLFLKDKICDIDLKSYILSDFTLQIGELEVMALYKNLNADRLLIDDKKAKKVAIANGIKVIGSLGVLLSAKKINLINEIKTSIEMIKSSNIFIDDKTIKIVLELAGEI
ncbi:MAG: DUF3368 domain-containing protein [Campylobacterales bacterium]|nr:DUF3368 domain-containing protein [Campylobacterales bacterium]